MSATCALVTGAGRGIGRGIARRLSETHAVAVNDIDDSNARETAAEIRDAGGEAIAVPCDVSEPDDIEGMVDRVWDQLGPIDVLVNNAGIETVHPFVDLPEADWDAVHDVNLKGPFLLSQAIVGRMIDDDIEGSIVNVTSYHDTVPRTDKIHYDTSKAGLHMLTKDMALEMAEHGIDVNCVAPGIVESPMNADILEDPERIEAMNERVPLGRMASPEDVAAVVAFLVSEDAEYLTGVRIPVDGGLQLDP
jgi:glucose 1-dehydrogenase